MQPKNETTCMHFDRMKTCFCIGKSLRFRISKMEVRKCQLLATAMHLSLGNRSSSTVNLSMAFTQQIFSKKEQKIIFFGEDAICSRKDKWKYSLLRDCSPFRMILNGVHAGVRQRSRDENNRLIHHRNQQTVWNKLLRHSSA